MINEKIIEIRQKNKLSQSGLGKILGVTQNAIGRIERNQQDADLKLLMDISEQFNVSVHYLLSGEEASPIDQTELTELRTEVRILREMLKLPQYKK